MAKKKNHDDENLNAFIGFLHSTRDAAASRSRVTKGLKAEEPLEQVLLNALAGLAFASGDTEFLPQVREILLKDESGRWEPYLPQLEAGIAEAYACKEEYANEENSRWNPAGN